MVTAKKTDEKNKKTAVKKTQRKTTPKKEMTINDIPSDLLESLTKQITEQVMKNVKTQANVIEEDKKEQIDYDGRFTKAMLNKVRSDEVVVTSYVDSVFFLSPKTNMKYNWSKMGDSEIMTIDEILVMESTSERFLHTPWLRVDDRRIIEAFNLDKIYKTIDIIDDTDKLLKLKEDEIVQLFENIPYSCRMSYKQNVYDKLYAEVKSHKLNDLRVIEALEKALNINLLNISE